MANEKKKEFWRAAKFTLISISAGIIQIGLFTLLYELIHIDYWISYLVGLLASVVWNFTINRKYTFKSANNVKVAMLLILAFYAVFTPLSTWLGHLAETGGVDGMIVEILTMLANFVLEFVYSRFVVYRNSCDTAVKTQEGVEIAVEENV